MNLDREDHRIDSAYLAYEQPFAANASAIVFLFANLNYLMNTGGPDLYRLAHLEAGMVATIEPGLYVDGFGGVRIEDDVVVEARGCRLLTHSDRSLRVIT